MCCICPPPPALTQLPCAPHLGARSLDLGPYTAHLTPAGLAELGALCPDTEALFTPPHAASLSAEALLRAFPGARCVLLGREISQEAHAGLLRCFEESGNIDLSGEAFARLAGLGKTRVGLFKTHINALLSVCV